MPPGQCNPKTLSLHLVCSCGPVEPFLWVLLIAAFGTPADVTHSVHPPTQLQTSTACA